MLRGIAYLHSANIIHRDLKPSNIALRNDGSSDRLVVKLLDLGQARVEDLSQQGMTRANTLINAPWYRAPELLGRKKHSGIKYTKAVDIWSVGCIMAELLTLVGHGGSDASWRVLFRATDAYSEHAQLAAITDVLGAAPAPDLELDESSGGNLTGRVARSRSSGGYNSMHKRASKTAEPDALAAPVARLASSAPSLSRTAEEAVTTPSASGGRDGANAIPARPNLLRNDSGSSIDAVSKSKHLLDCCVFSYGAVCWVCADSYTCADS